MKKMSKTYALCHLWSERQRIIRRVRKSGTALYNRVVLSPLDKVYHIAMGRGHYPPYCMKELAGRRGYTYAGSSNVTYVIWKLLCGLKPGHAILEIGPGPGKMAFSLMENGWEGQYYGVDSKVQFVDWCRKHITAKHPEFQFRHVDLTQPDFHVQPCPDNTFDLVSLHSVFTHMDPEAIQQYLKEIHRILKPGGRCYATVFLITDLNGHEFKPVVNRVCHWKPGTWAIEEGFMMEMIRAASLTVVSPIHYGRRSHGSDGLLHQDLFILEKSQPGT